MNLGESKKTDQPVSDFGGRHLPLSSVSFASRENLLAICPPFYSPRPLSARVPLMRFFFFPSFPGRGTLRGDGLLLAENTSPSSSAVHWTCHDDEVGSWVSPSFLDATEWAVASFSFSLWHSPARYLFWFSHALCCSLSADFPLSAVSVRKSSPAKGYQVYTSGNVSA